LHISFKNYFSKPVELILQIVILRYTTIRSPNNFSPLFHLYVALFPSTTRNFSYTY